MSNPLEDLIARAKKSVADKAAVAQAKAKAKDARNAVERQAANDEAMAIQNAMDWRQVALVFHKDHWRCQCGAEGEAPAGIFILFEHTRLSNTWRQATPRSGSYTRGETPATNDLPRRLQIDERTVAICPTCSPNLGFTKLMKEN